MLNSLGPRVAAIALSTAGIAAAPAAGAATFLSTGSASLCGTAGCFADGKAWRNTYAASGFSGPLSIGKLLLDRGILGASQDKLFRVSFRTVDGVEVGNWGSFMIAGLGGDVVQLGGQEFTWDGSWGDLVLNLELVVTDKGAGGGGGWFGGGGFGGGWSSPRVFYAPPEASAAPALQAVVTDERPQLIDLGPEPLLLAVPEPSAWALMLLGFGATGALLRSRRYLRV